MNMAKRKYSKMKKVEPSVQTLLFATPVVTGGQQDSFYVDLSQVASIVNRRFYRQGINWAVGSIKILTAAFTGAVQISKLPNTWVTSNSWEKGFRAWKRQQDEVLEDGTQDSVKARFNDFKIFMDTQHYTDGVSANLLPLDSAGNAATAGEWEASQIVVPNYGAPGTNWEPYLQMVGANGAPSTSPASIGLIAAYQNSRSVPQSPDPALPAGLTSLDNVYMSMFDVGDNNDDVLDNVSLKNNDLPYTQDEYPGGDTQLPGLQVHDYEFITATTVGGTTYMKGGNFPCGLIKFDCSNSGSTANVVIQIDLVPGTHRGYLCEPMTEM